MPRNKKSVPVAVPAPVKKRAYTRKSAAAPVAATVPVEKGVPLVITTGYKCVFFGYGVPESLKDGQMALTGAQMCLSWSADVRGVFGLAVTGPTAGCRIGPVVPAVTLVDVTAAITATPEAAAAWRLQPWAK